MTVPSTCATAVGSVRGRGGVFPPPYPKTRKVADKASGVVRVTQQCAALGAYVTLSILTVFWTKYLVAGKVPTPLFLSWVQQAVGLAVYSAVSVIVAALSSRRSACGRALAAAFPPIRVKGRVMLRVLPLSLCFVGMIGSANVCLQRVQVSVYQVARSLTLVFSLLLSIFWLKQRVLKGEVFSCLLVASGFALMTAVGSDSASLTGYIMGALASLFQAAYTVQMKATLNCLEAEEEDLVHGPKVRSAYQLISSSSTDAVPRNGYASTHTNSKGSFAERERAASPHITAVVVKTSGDVCKTAESGRGVRSLRGADTPMEELAFSERSELEPCKSIQQTEQPRHPRSECTSAVRSFTELEEVEQQNQQEFASGTTSKGLTERKEPRARVEPLCVFYNMLNAICLFPIVLLLSDEPRVLWNLAAEGTAMNSTVISQVLGLGKPKIRVA
ncbi:uncharacterized protein LOC34617322 [Cyclospora cayetanensis]|uniref:Uncharacterized protein LOC34617322 n=1 Tax=Cyclospora cayetanensis TaxID=88456 RepID=A0A6P6RR50_9EIME|nr:uncharacterized protein LOC34617322 [Cyclospora cayetanensis]